MTRGSQIETASLMLLVIGLWGSCSKPTAAQHSDVQFSYVNQRIEVQPQDPRGLVFAGNFPTSTIERQFTTLPGFASETDVGLGIGGGDQIVYNVLDNLLFWDGNDFAAPANGTQIRVKNNPPSIPDTFVTPTSGEQLGSFSPPLNRIGAAGSSGDFHVDLQWFLEPNTAPSPPPPELGAYGVKLTLSTDEPGIGDSDPLFMVFNFGLDHNSYDAALGAFAGLLTVPDPNAIACDFTSDSLCGLADINAMFAQGDLVAGVAVGSGNQYDLNSDLSIDGDDITEWLRIAGANNGYGGGDPNDPNAPFLRGDTDHLDNLSPTTRTVDITDFTNFLSGFTGAGSTWLVGNFDGNGVVDITDFSNHFLPSFAATGGGTYGPSQAIPEPSTVLLLGLGVLLLAWACYGRRNAQP